MDCIRFSPLPLRERAWWGVHLKGKALESIARVLRHNQTETEKRLWRFLRSREFLGYKFRRQQPIGHYIAISAALKENSSSSLTGVNMRSKNQKTGSAPNTFNERDLKLFDFGITRFLKIPTAFSKRSLSTLNHPRSNPLPLQQWPSAISRSIRYGAVPFLCIIFWKRDSKAGSRERGHALWWSTFCHEPKKLT